jgi:osmotically-inducible protein OsmY
MKRSVYILMVSAGWCAIPIHGQQTNGSTDKTLVPIVVTARQIKADEEMAEQVKTALHASSYVGDGHVTVTTINGVVTLHGLVFDEWDERAMKRIARRMPGVRRVIDDLYLVQGGD